MKKLIFILLCFFSVKIVHANKLDYVYLPYYVKTNIKDEEKIIQVKKVFDKETLQVVFNIDFNNYDTKNNFNTYEEVNKNNYGMYFRNLSYFNTITHYGYNLNKSDLNYFLTQVFIWQSFCSNKTKITDILGNEITDYVKDFSKIANKIAYHNSNSNFVNKTYNSEIWDKSIFTYYNHNLILDNPIIEGLNFENNNYNLIINNLEVGEYKINLFKDYDHLNYSYNDGINIYWQNLGGPADIDKSFKYNVYGINLKIKENLIGINNRFGDAILDSKYELYLNDELKLIINSNSNNYIKSNSNYILKDINNSNGFYTAEDMIFKSNTENLEIIIDKYVISKNISVSILDDKEYYVYLKSNNELYEILDNDTNTITLPYGTYYIVDKENSYYQEINVIDDMDEEIIINDKKEDNIINNNIKNEYLILEKDNLIGEDINNIISNDIVQNPKTVDNIYLYIIFFIFSNLSIIGNKFILKKFI